MYVIKDEIFSCWRKGKGDTSGLLFGGRPCCSFKNEREREMRWLEAGRKMECENVTEGFYEVGHRQF